MIRNSVIALLTVCVVALGVWGYNEKKENDTLKITAENNYQRAFHELAFHIDQIEDQLGATLAMNTRRQLTPSLAEVWRVTSLAQEEIGQLPLTSLNLDNTEQFLYKLGKFAHRTSIRDLHKDALTEDEYETLEQLYKHAQKIRNEIRKSQAMVLARGDRWLNIDAEMQASEEKLDNQIVSQFEVMNKTVEGISETDWGAGLEAIEDINGDLKEALTGKEVSKKEAEKIARKYLNIDEQVPIHMYESGDSLKYKAYTILADDPDHGTHYHMDIAVNGGEPIWFLQDRQINEQNISLNEAAERAKQYLLKNGKKNMQLIDSKQYDSVAMLQFAHVHDNVRVYTDSIMLQVALDDGDILGYEAKNYLLHHKDRPLQKPKLSKEEAAKSLNPRLKVMEDHIALIKNDLKDEVLCYEFLGVINNDTYRIFVNAMDGEEEKVERLDHAEPVYSF